jgi:hypothetical protein
MRRGAEQRKAADYRPAQWLVTRVSLGNPFDVAARLDRLREVGATEQVTVLADRAAAHVPLDDPAVARSCPPFSRGVEVSDEIWLAGSPQDRRPGPAWHRGIRGACRSRRPGRSNPQYARQLLPTQPDGRDGQVRPANAHDILRFNQGRNLRSSPLRTTQTVTAPPQRRPRNERGLRRNLLSQNHHQGVLCRSPRGR